MPAARSRKRVYVSSTFVDLKEHRTALKAALEQAGFDVGSMERYPAFDERPLDYCLNDVAGCDAYVLLLAHRYGYRPDIERQRTLSITEREYRHAREQGKPCFVFCVAEEYGWNPKHIDSPRSRDGRALAALRKRVAEAHGLRTFTDPDNLAHQVLAALSAHAWPEIAQPSAPASPTGYQWPAAWDFGPYMAQRREGFEGREWLFQDITVWLADSPSRALLVQADFGVGKSAFMAELVQRNPGNCIAAFHFCQYDTQDTLHPGHFVRSVAAQLAAALPAYKALVETDATLQERLNRALEDPGSAFEGGVLAPLAKLAAPREPRLLLVDALDESLELDAETARRSRGIVDLLGARAGRFPPWLKVLATTRSNPDVMRRLDGFAPRLIDAESAANVDDLRSYVLHCAARKPLSEQLHEAGTTAQALAELLAGKSQGKFLLAVRAVRALEEEDASGGSRHMRLDELAALPPGMDAWYFDAFERRYARVGHDYESTRAVLGVLAAAREPLSVETVAAVLGTELAAVKAVRQLLPDFLQLRAGRLAFDHFSLAEWLTREDEQGFPRAGRHAVDLPASQTKLYNWALAQTAAGTAHQSSYLLRHLAAHLTDDTERRQIYGDLMFRHFKWLQARLDQDGIDALLSDAKHLLGLPEQPFLEALLRNGAHVLRAYTDQLVAQVLGRVGANGSDSNGILTFLKKSAKEYIKQNEGYERTKSVLMPASRSLRLSTGHVATFQGGGETLSVLSDGRIVSGSVDGTVCVWDPRSSTEPVVFKCHAFKVTALAALPDGRIVSGSQDRTVRVWDPQGHTEPQVFSKHKDWITAVTVLRDGRIASSSNDRTVRIWDPERRTQPQLLKGHENWVTALSVLPDGHIASGSHDCTVRIWDIKRHVNPLVFRGHTREVIALIVLRDGRIASGSFDCTVQVWDSCVHSKPLVLEGHAAKVGVLAELPDGRIASGSDDCTVRVWDLQRRTETLVFRGHTDAIRALAVLSDGRIVSGSNDGTVRVWNTKHGTESLLFEGHAYSIRALASLPNGRVASASSDHTVRVWDPQGCIGQLPFEGHGGYVNALAVLPDQRIASGSWDRTVRVWDLQYSPQPSIAEEHTAWVNALAVLSDGRIASGCEDGTVRVWDPQRRTPPVMLGKHARSVSALAILPDGRIASGSDDQTLRIWSLSQPTNPLVLQEHTLGISRLAVLPDGRIASGSSDNTVRVWDPRRRCTPLLLDGHIGGVTALAVLPDGRIISGSGNGSVQVWNPQRDSKPVLFKVHTRKVTALAALANGRIISSSLKSTTQIWDPQGTNKTVEIQGYSSSVCALAVSPDMQIVLGYRNGAVRTFDVETGELVCAFIADATITCLIIAPSGLIVAGCADGAVHFLRPNDDQPESRLRNAALTGRAT